MGGQTLSCQVQSDFQNSFTTRLCGKSAKKGITKIIARRRKHLEFWNYHTGYNANKHEN